MITECPNLATRFWSKVDKDGPPHPTLGKCWIWTASKRQGYGCFRLAISTGRYTSAPAHRIAYQLRHGAPPPPNLDLDHQCNNRACVNPDHLKPLTRRDNLARDSRFAGNRTHCPSGHEYTPENTVIRVYDGYVRRYCGVCISRRCIEGRNATLTKSLRNLIRAIDTFYYLYPEVIQFRDLKERIEYRNAVKLIAKGAV